MADYNYDVRDLQHIAIGKFRETFKFKPPTREQNREPLRPDYAAHAASLIDQLAAAMASSPLGGGPRLQIANLKPGALVEIATRAPDEKSRVKAAKVPSGLDFLKQGIVILRTERHDDRTEHAVWFVPDDAHAFLENRIKRYGRNPGNQERPDVEKFELIESLDPAPPALLFTGAVDFSAPGTVWWELWVRGQKPLVASLAAHARAANFDVHPETLEFPDTTVLYVHATVAALLVFASQVPGAITEVRRAMGTIEPFLDPRDGKIGQHDFVEDLVGRVTPPPAEAPTVCVLDTGVSAAHPLLTPGLQGAWAYNEDWGVDDHHRHGGHGTGLVGLVLYGDLEPLMNSAAPVALTHSAESMKLLPPPGIPETPPRSWGIFTQGAVSSAELERQGILRSFCLANSATFFPPSRPSSWSGALDQIAAGVMKGEVGDDGPDNDRLRRLILVATGNVQPGHRTKIEALQPLEDPAQSWNALTVGGFTRKDTPPKHPRGLTPVVPANHRSPFSLGSHALPYDLTPIKPEVLFEAGNMVADASGHCDGHDSVALLTTGSDVVAAPLMPFWATSAAVGMAGNFAGRLQAALPDLWPETHRALTVDSATWPQPIRAKLIGTGAHWKTGTKRQKQQILREFGYGVPDLERAVLSSRNDVTLIAQAEIQPFALNEDRSGAVFNEMHFYKLPWPRLALQALENEIVTMKVTLSYFMEPNLSGKAATRPDTYRSYGLRFAMKKRAESEPRFRARINASQAKDGTVSQQEADYWLLGPKAVEAGSLHCDLWRGYAVDLAGHDGIAVYPVGGWWKSHLGQKRMNSKGRYALVVSISAPGQTVDLHAEVTSLVEAAAVEVPAA